MLHFYTESCPPCKMLEHRAFRDPTFIRSVTDSVIPVKVDADEQRNVADHFAVTRWPTDVYLFPDGSELHRTVCPQDPAAYAQLIGRVSTRCRDWITERAHGSNLPMKFSPGTEPALPPASPEARPITDRGSASGVPATFASFDRNESSPPNNSANSAVDASSPRPKVNRYRNEAPHFQSSSMGNQPGRSVEVISPFVQPPNSIPSNPLMAAPSPNPPAQAGNNSNRSLLVSAPASMQVTREPTTPQNFSEDAKDLVLDGYCPIALEAKRWERGCPEYAARHRGRIYYFTSDEARSQFMANPDRYSPMFSGYDVVRLLENGQIVSGKREFGCWFSGRVFLFESEETRRIFDANVDRYLQQLQALQSQSAASNAGR